MMSDSQPREGDIPKVDTAALKLPQINLDDSSVDWIACVENEVDKAVKSVDSIDWTVLDVVGAQMESVSAEFSTFIETTQALFTALVNLKQFEKDAVNRKKDQVTAILAKLTKALAFIHKL